MWVARRAVPRLGLQLLARSYNTFVVSVVAFLLQFSAPPPELFARGKVALRSFAPGPGNWIRQSDLCHFRDRYGFSFAFRSVDRTCLASQAHILRYGRVHLDARLSNF